ncbi:MAG: FAD-dependent oxidoreductase [Ardenticatenaceae bacterium]|nr:FAD-dependent oxidoreductase [Ardenticatenaceae bacterium]MCB8974265.1 FAD-dependent oxidoreductase [Ardenticatenaceae bacterium]
MNGFSLDKQDNNYDVVIIGGGPAGASAAIYTARSELRTLVIDKGLTAGALGVTSKISNYPGVPGPISGAKLVEIMREQAESFGAKFITDKVVGITIDGEQKEVIAGTGNFRAKVLILATGAMGRTSTVSGEEELLGRGVSYCATCDGAFFRDQDVAVVGNNDEALEEALFLTKYAKNIHLIVPTPELKARASLAEEVAENPKIQVHLATRLKEINGNGRVQNILIHPRKGEPETLPVTGAFVYLQGSQPITDYLMGQLDTTNEGCLVVDSEMQTSMPGVFAVGDLLCTHIKQAVVAASDGVLAAVAADKYVNGRKKAVVDWK